MDLLSLVPKRVARAKAFFPSLSDLWYVPVIDEATTHEGLGKHLREAELRISQERAILPKVLPQIRQNHREDGLAGALMLKLIQHKDTLGQVSDGALGLGFSSQCLLTFVHPLFRSCDSCLFSFSP